MGSDVFVVGAVKGLVRGFKSLISLKNATQQPITTNPSQQFFIAVADPISSIGIPTASPTTMAPSIIPNRLYPETVPHPYNSPDLLYPNNNNRHGPFNRTYPPSPASTQSHSSRRPLPKIPNNSSLDLSQVAPSIVWDELDPPPYSVKDPGYGYKDGGDGTDEGLVGNIMLFEPRLCGFGN